MLNTNVKKKIGQRGDQLFQIALLAWPLLQFAVFYVVVNLNSFKLSFQEWVAGGNGGFSLDNFEYVFTVMFSDILGSVGTSVLFYLISTAISVPLALLFAFYIFKKAWGSKLFRLFLFLPSIVSSMVMSVLFSEFLLTSGAEILLDWFGIDTTGQPIFDATNRSSYTAVMFFYLWVNFGTTTLIYSNKMSELSPETIEAAQLDGANYIQEFWYIVLPFTFPTLSVFIVTGFATLFTNQYELFSFYGGSIGFDPGTMGYYMYALVQDYASSGNYDHIDYNRASAVGILATLVIVPTAMGLRWALEKFGPQE